MTLQLDFPMILTLLVLLSGIVGLIDVLFFAKKRKQTGDKQPWYFDYARSFFPALLIVWIIRSFIVEPYRVPTGSLEPTVMPGDFIAVQRYVYGLRSPILNVKFFGDGKPKVGDVALFFWPIDPTIRFVKRVIGVPGDHVVYKNKVLTLNGKEMPQTMIGPDMNIEPGQLPRPVIRKKETINGIEHDIFIEPNNKFEPTVDVVVPQGQYFMMGDNRDDSRDSRYWGFVPEQNLIGRAFAVWFSWDSDSYKPRFSRMFKGVS